MISIPILSFVLIFLGVASCSMSPLAPAMQAPQNSSSPGTPGPDRPPLTATARALSHSMTSVVLTLHARPPSPTPPATETPTPLPTVRADYFDSWARFHSDDLAIEIDYPAYLAISPYSDLFCAPFDGTDRFNGSSYLSIGDRFHLFTPPSGYPSQTLQDHLQAAEVEMRALSHTIVTVEWREIDRVPAVTLSYFDFLGNDRMLTLFLRGGTHYTASVGSGGECSTLAAQQAPDDPLDQWDTALRMFDTLRFVP